MNSLDAVFTELDRLGSDIEQLLPAMIDQAGKCDPADSDYAFFGCGDSYIAAQAMAPVLFNRFNIKSRVLFPRELLEDGTDAIPVAISASGNTPPVVDVLRRCKESGRKSIILTANPDSDSARLAAHAIVGELADKISMVPGIRSYQASLLSILALAIGNSKKPSISTAAAKAFIDETVKTCRAEAGPVARTLTVSGPALFIGEGTDLASAAFGAAKRLEMSGEISLARDTEEYWHLERFLRAPCPVILIASGGDTADSVRIAQVIRALDAHLTVVAPREATQTVGFANEHISLPDRVPDEFRPLVTGVAMATLAGQECVQRGILPFQKDAPHRIATMRERISKDWHPHQML